jgi:hypothetical protein
MVGIYIFLWWVSFMGFFDAVVGFLRHFRQALAKAVAVATPDYDYCLGFSMVSGCGSLLGVSLSASAFCRESFLVDNRVVPSDQRCSSTRHGTYLSVGKERLLFLEGRVESLDNNLGFLYAGYFRIYCIVFIVWYLWYLSLYSGI